MIRRPPLQDAPYYKRPHLSEAVDVTLCIGALALAQPITDARVVLATDFKLSDSWVSSEKEWKVNVLSPDLIGLYAGRPGRAREWSLMCREHLAKITPTRATLIDELRAVTAALKVRLKFKLGTPYEQLLVGGPTIFGADEFRRRLDQAMRYQVGVQMIIAGYVESKVVLLRYDDLGDEFDFEEITNHAAIGSGSYEAYHALMARSHSAQSPFDEVVYQVYEAKKAGEKSAHVGTTTRILVLGHDDNHGTYVAPMMPPEEKWVEKLHRRYRPRPLNPFAIELPEKAFSLRSPLIRQL